MANCVVTARKRGVNRHRETASGGDTRFNVLKTALLLGIQIGGHVAGATTTSRDHFALQGWRLQVLGLDLGSLGAVNNVAGATAAGGLHVRHCWLVNVYVKWQAGKAAEIVEWGTG